MPFMIIIFGVTGLIALQHSFSVTIIVLCIGLTIFFVGGGNLKQIADRPGDRHPRPRRGAMALSGYPLKRMQDWYARTLQPRRHQPGHAAHPGAARAPEAASARIPASGSRKPGCRCCGATICSPISARTWACPACCWWWCCTAALAYRGLTIALNTRDRFAALAAMGVTIWISVQAAIHIGASLMLIPTTGQPLPFMSYGGSSLLATMIAAGLLLSISRSETEKKAIHAHFGFGWRDSAATSTPF